MLSGGPAASIATQAQEQLEPIIPGIGVRRNNLGAAEDDDALELSDEEDDDSCELSDEEDDDSCELSV